MSSRSNVARPAKQQSLKQLGPDEDWLVDQIADFLNSVGETEYRVLPTTTKNFLLIGKTRSGKTTAVQTLESPISGVNDYDATQFSESIDPVIKSLLIQHGAPDEFLNLNLFDTPGLFEVIPSHMGNTPRDLEKLSSIILKFLRMEISKLHGILFTMSYTQSGLNPEDLEAFSYFFETFKGAEAGMCLLITHAESLNHREKDAFISELRKMPKLSEQLHKFGHRIFFLGALSQSDADRGFADHIQVKMRNILDMRKKLISHIINDASIAIALNDLASIIKPNLEEAREIKVLLENELFPGSVRSKELYKKLELFLPVFPPSERSEVENFLRFVREQELFTLTPIQED